MIRRYSYLVINWHFEEKGWWRGRCRNTRRELTAAPVTGIVYAERNTCRHRPRRNQTPTILKILVTAELVLDVTNSWLGVEAMASRLLCCDDSRTAAPSDPKIKRKKSLWAVVPCVKTREGEVMLAITLCLFGPSLPLRKDRATLTKTVNGGRGGWWLSFTLED